MVDPILSLYRTSTTVNLHEIDETCKPYQDTNLTVTPVVIQPIKNNKRSFQTYSYSSGSDSESSSSDSETRLATNSIMTDLEAQEYRNKVVDMMFTNTNQGQKPPGHTIEAECTPRSTTTHPLSQEGGEKVATARVVNNNQRNFLIKSLPRTTQDLSAITYICQGASMPPKFNKAAALALGIKPGPIYGQLQKGMAVTLPDGKVVTRGMVCDAEVPGHVFVVVDCPNISYIDGLIKSDAFDKYLDPKGESKINVMIHHLGNGVIHDARYKQWLSKFDVSTDVRLLKFLF